MVSKSKKKVIKRKHKKKNKKGLFIFGLLLLALLIFLGAYLYYYYWYQNRFHTFDDFSRNKSYPIRGVDVSHHNTFIDWRQLYKDNVTFVFLKATEGSDHNDRNYQENYQLAKGAGLTVGTYHFYTFGSDGNKQAQHFIRNANVNFGDLIPAIDVEHSKINKEVKDEKELEKVIIELKNLENSLFKYFGKHPIIYTNKRCYGLYIENNFPNNPLWICDLHAEPDERFANWEIWQFSHTGRIKGANDLIDLNYYRGTKEEFSNLLIH